MWVSELNVGPLEEQPVHLTQLQDFNLPLSLRVNKNDKTDLTKVKGCKDLVRTLLYI